MKKTMKLLTLALIAMVTMTACEKEPVNAPETGPDTEAGTDLPMIEGKWQILTVEGRYYDQDGDQWVLGDESLEDYEKMGVDVWAHFLPGARMVWEVDDDLMYEKCRIYDYHVNKHEHPETGAYGFYIDSRSRENRTAKHL